MKFVQTKRCFHHVLGLFLGLSLSMTASAHGGHHPDHDDDDDEYPVANSPLVPSEYKSQVVRERSAETFRESPDLNKMTILWGNDYNQGAMSAAVETIKPGKKIPLHIHKNAEELIYIVHGEGIETLGDTSTPVRKGDLVVVTPGTIHGLENTGNEPLKFFFVYNTNEMMQFFRDYSFRNRKDVEQRFNQDFIINLLIKHSSHFAVPSFPAPTAVQIPLRAN
jgi:mannose-6-phosphate isomerase-like protein (cupin superfamily)